MGVAPCAPDNVSECPEGEQLASRNRGWRADREERASAAVAVPPLVPDGQRSMLAAEHSAVTPDAANERA